MPCRLIPAGWRCGRRTPPPRRRHRAGPAGDPACRPTRTPRRARRSAPYCRRRQPRPHPVPPPSPCRPAAARRSAPRSWCATRSTTVAGVVRPASLAGPDPRARRRPGVRGAARAGRGGGGVRGVRAPPVELAAFAADLVARGRLLPIALDDPPRAVWRPVLTGPDAAWARVLAVSMPPPLAAAIPAHELDRVGRRPGRAGRRGRPRRARFAPAEPRSCRRPGHPGLAGRADRRRAHLRRGPGCRSAALATRWPTGSATPSPGRCGPASGSSSPTRPRTGRSGSRCRPPTSRAWWSTPSRCGAPAASCRRWPVTSTRPQETLLAELGKASRLYPDLDGALRTARPTGLPLDTDGAHRFLSAVGADAGHGRLRRPAAGLVDQAVLAARPAADRLDAGPARARVAGNASACGFDVARRVPLRPGRRRRGADRRRSWPSWPTLKAPMVRLRGQWIELDAAPAGGRPEARRAHGSRLTRAASCCGSGSASTPGPARTELPVEGVEADGWLGDLLSGRPSSGSRRSRPPEAFAGELRPYQERGLAWLDFLQPRRARRRPRRRHGSGQDGPAARPAGASTQDQDPSLAGLPDVAGRQLAAGGGPVHPAAAGARPPRRGTGPRQAFADAVAAPRPRRHHLRAGRPGRRRAAQDRLAPGRRRRGAGDQERRHQAGDGDPLAARRRPGSR